MQSADFDKLTSSRPVNKLAMIVTQSNGVDNVQEIYDRFRDLDESIGRLTVELRTSDLTKKEKDKIGKERRKLRLEKNELSRKYPFLSKKKKLELTPLILDEVKKIMSKEDWNACVVRAKAKLEQNFIENDLIDPNSRHYVAPAQNQSNKKADIPPFFNKLG